MDEIIKFIVCGIMIILVVVIMLLAVLVPIGWLFKAIHPDVEVYVDQKIIYRGSDACVDIQSSGYNTTVKTSKFFCILPDKSYTSKDVVVRMVE